MPRVCPVCHREATVESDFCPACGAPMNGHVQDGRMKAAARALDNPPMKWHKFLTWFILPFSLVMAAVGLVNAWQDVTGFDPSLYYPEYVSLMRFFVRLNLAAEAVIIILAAAALYHMMKMKWNGVRLVLLMYGVQFVYALIVLYVSLRLHIDLLQAAASIISSVVIILLTWIYYKKRKKLFT